MKLALRLIPTEVWVDIIIFPWISRKQLGEIVHRFRNRKFIEILQYCLHERGKRTLGTICLDKVEVIPRAPLPDNIKFFNYIKISHFDSLAIDFLHRVSPLFISNDVNLDLLDLSLELGYDLINVRTVFDHLSPLLHGIHSITFDHDAIPLVQQYFGQKLAQFKRLALGIDFWLPQTAIDFAMDWLTSEEHKGPRMLAVFTNSHNIQQFFTVVQQQFLSAKRQCTFAVHLVHYYGLIDRIAGFHLENNLGEQLHGEYRGPWLFQILRHRPNAGTALQEWVAETDEKCSESSVIRLSSTLTIGQISADADTNEVDDNTDSGEEEEENEPSTSE